MAPQDGYSPAAVAEPAELAAELTAAHEMRPLSLGEVLDRTFSVYRSRFWLFAGISAVSGAVQLLADVLNVVAHHLVLVRWGFRVAFLGTQIGGGVAGLLFFLAAAVTQAATIYALGEVYLGRATSIGDSLRATAGRWYRYLGIALWQAWSVMWLPLVLLAPVFFLIPWKITSLYWLSGVLIFLAICGGIPFGVVCYLRNSLAVPASVEEQLEVRPSMRRSKLLAAGTKGRIFVVLLIAGMLFWVAAAVEAPMLFFIARAPLQEHVMAQMTILVVTFVSHTLISPVALIGLALVYFDQRVRKEAFDLLMLLGQETAGAQPVHGVEFPTAAGAEFQAPAAVRLEDHANEA
jgi:hypothetical protein